MLEAITRRIQRRAKRLSRGLAKSSSSHQLPTDIPIDEETNADYTPKKFYPAEPAEILAEHYRLIAKIGWGRYSTIWLARDLRCWWWDSNRIVTVKISTADDGSADRELEIEQQLLVNPKHSGFQFVRTTIDDFTVTGPDATHRCLVFKPLREPLNKFLTRWKKNKISPRLLKMYLVCILHGLHYMHSECAVIHTDLNPTNIMITFEDPAVVDAFIDKAVHGPQLSKTKDGRVIYQAQNDFGDVKVPRLVPQIVDFGASTKEDGTPHTAPIQPPAYRAPEVLLGTSWSYSADIWNLGVMSTIWNLLEARDLFQHSGTNDNTYSPKAHLAEMIALLGPPPQALIDREAKWRDVNDGDQWPAVLINPQGKWCRTPHEYWDGPFFGSNGKFKYADLIPANVTLESSVTTLEGDEKQLFLDFVKNMICWLPEDRLSARDLLHHPWLKNTLRGLPPPK